MTWRPAKDPSAWVDLPRVEDDAAWQFIYDLEFQRQGRPVDQRASNGPPGSVTWSLTPLLTADEAQFLAHEVHLAERLCVALDQVRGSDDYVIALDWQHPCYQFSPQRATAPTAYDDWLIPALPNGDYYHFVAQDFRFGWLTHPWEESVCVFGALLPVMRNTLEDLGLPVIREKPVEPEG